MKKAALILATVAAIGTTAVTAPAEARGWGRGWGPGPQSALVLPQVRWPRGPMVRTDRTGYGYGPRYYGYGPGYGYYRPRYYRPAYYGGYYGPGPYAYGPRYYRSYGYW